ncbi:hypothetical protein CAPTEDRAFT_148704 [Capitella teleta]|uniref:EF-hand domain-containing family member C2 n=1 Tax=Capitella teleta TaxID=283909 RepID=R7U500_CAPTE|nr:hypothetical protein CAPTEDRAFT_148704 [Capitella teleta]|eukprot:ELU01034.1 hypothetical protein CAPTEDRAFT_148704 [Capitella teleta]
MALPFLPGNSFNPNVGRTKYHKTQQLGYCNSVPIVSGEDRAGSKGSCIPRGTGSDLPSWVAFDKQVLCFDAYYQEAVHEKREEQFRVHSCKIYFYLEDDSIQVVEPRMQNSGLPQGTLIRRHRIPRPPPCDNTYYTIEDFNIGNELVLYAKNFKITGCDGFTKNFLHKLGVRLNAPESIPDDPYASHRKAMSATMDPKRPYERTDTLKQFLDHDRHVLRFSCRWDDTDNMFGDQREMVLHYFLADDTIEIREIIPPNSGRDATPMFLKRSRLPKIVSPLTQPGEITDRTVLNVFGPMGHGGRYILDSLKATVPQDFYVDADLRVGAVLNVMGRPFILTDADDFTREYYKQKFAIADMSAIDLGTNKKSKVLHEPPPYNGFGSEEDSLCSCTGLLPKPPRRDFIKFMQKDRHGLDSNVLRFLARMDTATPVDVDRRFIVSYFLSDDTILIYEPIIRNSGIIGGKFLERGRVKKPNQPNFSTQLSQYYMARDLYVGAQVIINDHKFVFVDADEYAYNYMERNAEKDGFVHANVGQILPKLAQVLASQNEDASHLGSSPVSFEQFRSLLQDLSQGMLSEHEIVTLARFYQDNKDNSLSIETLLAVAQEELRKVNFEDFRDLQTLCIQHDTERCGLLSPEQLHIACLAMKIPLPGDLMRNILQKVPRNEAGLIDYNNFLGALNWRDHPLDRLSIPDATGNPHWLGNDDKTQIRNVNIQALVQDLSKKPSAN